jgi:hypothetical protein
MHSPARWAATRTPSSRTLRLAWVNRGYRGGMRQMGLPYALRARQETDTKPTTAIGTATRCDKCEHAGIHTGPGNDFIPRLEPQKRWQWRVGGETLVFSCVLPRKCNHNCRGWTKGTEMRSQTGIVVTFATTRRPCSVASLTKPEDPRPHFLPRQW